MRYRIAFGIRPAYNLNSGCWEFENLQGRRIEPDWVLRRIDGHGSNECRTVGIPGSWFLRRVRRSIGGAAASAFRRTPASGQAGET